MLFKELDKLKRSVLMTTIILMFAGLLLMLMPEGFIDLIGGTLGFCLLVVFAYSVIGFIASSKAIIHYVLLAAGLVAGVLGACLTLNNDLLRDAADWLVIVIPILAGAYGICHAVFFARRSGRKGWYILVILSALLSSFGFFAIAARIVGLFRYGDNAMLPIQIIGGILTFSSIVSGLSLIWIWPVHRD